MGTAGLGRSSREELSAAKCCTFKKTLHQTLHDRMGKNESGPHRCERVAFVVAGLGEARPSRSKAGPWRSQASFFEEKVMKNTAQARVFVLRGRRRIAFLANSQKQGLDTIGGSVFGPHRRERIAFVAKCGDTRLGPSKLQK